MLNSTLEKRVDKLSFRETKWLVNYFYINGLNSLPVNDTRFDKKHYAYCLKNILGRKNNPHQLFDEAIGEMKRYKLSDEYISWFTKDILASLFIINLFYQSDELDELYKLERKNLSTSQEIYFEAEFLIDKYCPHWLNNIELTHYLNSTKHDSPS